MTDQPAARDKLVGDGRYWEAEPTGRYFMEMRYRAAVGSATDKFFFVEIAAPVPERGGSDAWLIHFEDASLRPEIFSGAGSEEGARRRFAEASTNWNCNLFRIVSPLRAHDQHVLIPQSAEPK